jgi:uncharacterized protein (TIGR01777 family)
MKIGITGASGLIGTALQPVLREQGHEVVRFTRDGRSAPDARPWDPATGRLDPADVADLDAVVNLSGAGVARRWTRSHKDAILRSRVDSTLTMSRAIAAARSDGTGPSVLLSGSAIGFYGDTGNEVTDETGPAGSGFLADVVQQWEDATAPAIAAGVRVAFLRTGIVLSPSGGALAPQRLAVRSFLGAPVGSGRQWQSWITLDDHVHAVAHLLTADVSGPVNLVGPHAITQKAFTLALGRALHRPVLPVHVPGFVLRTLLGGFAQEGVLIGQRLVPTVLNRSRFTFTHPDLDEALAALLRS